jgi:hypothetical protein
MSVSEKSKGADLGSAPSSEKKSEKKEPSYSSDEFVENNFDRSKTQAKNLEDKFAKKKESTKGRPLLLQREIPPPKPFPFEALGPVLGPVAKRLHEIIKAPDSICGNSILAAASLVVQAYADIHIDGRVHPLSLFMITVAESGDRKSAVDSIALKAIRDYEKMLKKTSIEAKEFYKNKMDVWKKQREQTLRENEREALEAALNKLSPEPRRPLEPYLILEEPTYEGLIKLYDVGQPSIGLFSDEGGRMFGGHSMGKDNFLKTACGLSSLWDGKPITRIRGGDENLLLYGKRFSTHLMIQEVVLASILKNEVLVGQGMLARCLIVAPLTNSGDRPYNPIDVSSDPLILEYWRRISAILDKPFPLSDAGLDNELAPRPLSLAPKAKERWMEFHDEVDRSLKPDGIYRSVRRMANKAAEQVLRIAGVLTLIEDFEAASISLDAIERAIQLMRYYLDEALRISDVSFSDPELDLAQAVLDWMKKKALEVEHGKIFSLQEIYQRAGPRGVRTQKVAKRIISILEEHKEVERSSSEKLEWKLSDHPA